jgi:hypothetical protein
MLILGQYFTIALLTLQFTDVLSDHINANLKKYFYVACFSKYGGGGGWHADCYVVLSQWEICQN